MSIPGLHTTIDYKKLIEMQANQVQEIVSPEKSSFTQGKVKQKNMRINNKINIRKR